MLPCAPTISPCAAKTCSLALGSWLQSGLPPQRTRDRRRSLAMLPPESPITGEKAIALIVRCQHAMLHHQHVVDTGVPTKPSSHRLRVLESRDSELHEEPGSRGRRPWHSRQLCCARPNMDAPHPGNYGFGESQRVRSADAAWSRWPTRGGCAVRFPSVTGVELHHGRNCWRDGRQASCVTQSKPLFRSLLSWHPSEDLATTDSFTAAQARETSWRICAFVDNTPFLARVRPTI